MYLFFIFIIIACIYFYVANDTYIHTYIHIGLFLLYPTYQDIFSKSPLLEKEHVVCYNLVEGQKAMKITHPQKTDLFAHS